MFVITADQVDSRRFHDRVPAALTLLARSPAATGGASRTFERTAGDEIQGVCEGAEEVLDIVTTLIRHGQWRIGIGIGPVDIVAMFSMIFDWPSRSISKLAARNCGTTVCAWLV